VGASINGMGLSPFGVVSNNDLWMFQW